MNVAFKWAQLTGQVESLAMDPLALAANGAFKVLLMARRDAVTPLQHQINAAAVSEPQRRRLLRICVTVRVCVSV